MTWSRRFDAPIELPDGHHLRTLREAADHITGLPRKMAEQPHWQLAIATLIAAAEGRDFVMHARISVLRALNVDRPAPSAERRKRARKVHIIS